MSATTETDNVSRETYRKLVVQIIKAMRLGSKYRVKRFRSRRYNGKGKRQKRASCTTASCLGRSEK